MQFPQNFAARKHLPENDRNYHELESLLQILEDVACYDQLNLGGNLFVESLTRRVSTITEALSKGPSAASWSQSKEIIGRERCDSLLSGERRAEISKLTKERLDVETLKQRAHQPRGEVGAHDAAAAVRLGGLPCFSEDKPAKG